MDKDPSKTQQMDDLAEAEQVGLFREFLDFLRYNKKWWLMPILITLLVFGIFVILTGTPLAPFIYSLF